MEFRKGGLRRLLQRAGRRAEHALRRGAEGLQHVLSRDQRRRRVQVHREAHAERRQASISMSTSMSEGCFRPRAYHSEGHQDGMGVCLYLALMKRLFGDRFTFALLDDVVMSVDSGHRYQFCKLLKTHFPDTQFIITTHDRLWAEQMKSAGLVTAKTSIAFHSWTIDTGPLVESNQEIWDEIASALGKGKVEVAAAALRHHLEYVSRHLADQLGATPQFRADGNYELGELLPSVLKRMKDLYGKAAEAAQSWGNDG